MNAPFVLFLKHRSSRMINRMRLFLFLFFVVSLFTQKVIWSYQSLLLTRHISSEKTRSKATHIHGTTTKNKRIVDAVWQNSAKMERKKKISVDNDNKRDFKSIGVFEATAVCFVCVTFISWFDRMLKTKPNHILIETIVTLVVGVRWHIFEMFYRLILFFVPFCRTTNANWLNNFAFMEISVVHTHTNHMIAFDQTIFHQQNKITSLGQR